MKPNNHGFSLIQAIIGIAVMSLVGLMMASMIKNSYQHEARLSMLLESREFSGEFMELARSPNCGIKDLAAPIPVKDLTWSETTTYDLATGVAGRFMEVKVGDKYGSMKVDAITISPYRDRIANETKYVALDGADDKDFANAKKIKAALKMEVSSHKGAKSPLQVPIYLYLDTGRTNIIGCESAEEKTSLMATCAAMGGTWNDSEEKCSLPCPTGMNMVKNRCVMADPTGNTHCSVNEKCSVAPQFIM